jgi:hypothetical protein
MAKKTGTTSGGTESGGNNGTGRKSAPFAIGENDTTPGV